MTKKMKKVVDIHTLKCYINLALVKESKKLNMALVMY